MTTVLSKGQNAPLPAGEVTISVDVAAPVDLSALLVTPDMRVRSDADFVFYNQPTGAGVTLAPTTGRQTLRITPAAVPAEIHAVRAVITLDDASSSFGRTPPPVAHVFDAAGTELFSFTIPDLSSETVVAPEPVAPVAEEPQAPAPAADDTPSEAPTRPSPRRSTRSAVSCPMPGAPSSAPRCAGPSARAR